MYVVCFVLKQKQTKENVKFCSALPTLTHFNHQANKCSRSSSVQNMNSLHEIAGLTAGYCVSAVATRVMIKTIT